MLMPPVVGYGYFLESPILMSGWKSAWRWSCRKWALHPCLLTTCSNSQCKTHQIAQIRHFELQKRQYATIEEGLSLFWALYGKLCHVRSQQNNVKLTRPAWTIPLQCSVLHFLASYKDRTLFSRPVSLNTFYKVVLSHLLSNPIKQ